MNPGEIFETQDGSHSILSNEYGVSYHSKYGAIQESKHVFIDAGLRYQLLSSHSLSILEIGFGTGLNAFLSLLEAEQRQTNLYYEALEAFPISSAQAASLNYPQQLEVSADMAVHFRALHALEWDIPHPITPYFDFQKRKIDFKDYTSPPRFDVVFFDAFAPSAQPDLWEEEILRNMYDALLPGGALVTYCAKGSVKRGLKKVGFQLEALPGPPGKREMTRAVKGEK